MIINRLLLKLIMLMLVSGLALTGCGWEDEETTDTGATSAIASISFVSSSASKIVVKGSGSTQLPESSTLTFKVLNEGGEAVKNAGVSFSIADGGTASGVTFAPASATSDEKGPVLRSRAN